MYWQLGGNIEAVTTVCKYDWTECPFAIVDYIWSEVVTDVADSLANETVLWRILAGLFICTTVVQLIYWKIHWTKELKKTKINLEQFDFKLQDLELKVNILTYKAQYGTWPLPHIVQKNPRNNTSNIESTLSKLNEDSSWFKHLVTNARRKIFKEEDLTGSIEPKLSITEINAFNVAAKDTSSNFENKSLQPTILVDENLSQLSLKKKKIVEVVNDYTRKNLIGREMFENDSSITNVLEELKTDTKKKSFKSFSDKRLGHHLKSIILGAKHKLRRKIDDEISSSEYDLLDNHLSERKAFISNKRTNEKSRTPFNFNMFSKSAPILEDQIFSSSTTDTETRKDTQETLYQVRRKLENLHLALESYSSKDSSIKDNRNSKRVQTNFEENNIYDFKDNTNNFNNEIPIELQSAPININDPSEIFATYETCNDMLMNGPTTLTDHVANENYTTFENLIEDRSDEEAKGRRRTNKVNILALKKELSTYKEEFDKSLSETNVAINNNYYSDMDICNKNNDSLAQNSMPLINNETAITSRKSSSIEISKESDSEDKSTTALLQEALMIKQELIFKIESTSSITTNNDMNVQITTSEDEPYDYVEWPNAETHFQPKILDMITEESSGGSSTDKKSKKSKTYISQTIEKSEYSQIDIYKKDENEQKSNNDLPLINNYSNKVSENKINVEEKSTSSESSGVTENDRSLDIKCSNETVKMNDNATCDIENNNTTENKEGIFDHFPCDESGIATKIHEVNSCQNIDSIDSKANVTLSHLTESSSDTSVNRLLDRLIETERKCKSAKKSKTILQKELIEDSFNNLTNSNNFDESVHSENKECDNFLIELETEKHSFEYVKVLDNNLEINNKDNIQSDVSCVNETENSSIKFINTVIDENDKSFEKSRITEIKVTNYQEDISNEETSNIECNYLQKNISNMDLKAQSSVTRANKKYLEVDKETINTNSDKIENDNDFHNKEKQIIDNLDEKIVKTKKYMISENDSLATNKKVDKLCDAELKTKIDKKFFNKDASDFYNIKETPIQETKSEETKLNTKSYEKCNDLSSKNESFIQKSKPREKKFNTKSCETVKNVGTHALTSNQNRNSYDTSYKTQSATNFPLAYRTPKTMNFPLGLRNQEQSVSRIHQIPSCNSQPRQSVKSCFDLSNKRQLKAKSNLNLGCVEKTSPLPTHRRSKSYVTPRDVAQNIRNTREKNSESLEISSTSSPKIPREFRQNDQHDKRFYAERENNDSYESLSISSKSSSKSRIPILVDNIEINRCTSFKSLTASSRSSSKSHILMTPTDYLSEDQNNKESLILSNRSSKSCIPILRSREIIQEDECDLKLQNLIQRSLGMGENENDESVYITSLTASSRSSSKSYLLMTPTGSFSEDQNNKESLTLSSRSSNSSIPILKNREIIQKDECDLKLQNLIQISLEIGENKKEIEKEIQNDPIMVDQIEISKLSSQDAICVESNNKDLADTLSTTTSLSDSLDISNADKSSTTELKIFEVPEELTKEEYIKLLRVVNETPDLEQSSNVEELCSILGLSCHE